MFFSGWFSTQGETWRERARACERTLCFIANTGSSWLQPFLWVDISTAEVWPWWNTEASKTFEKAGFWRIVTQRDKLWRYSTLSQWESCVYYKRFRWLNCLITQSNFLCLLLRFYFVTFHCIKEWMIFMTVIDVHTFCLGLSQDKRKLFGSLSLNTEAKWETKTSYVDVCHWIIDSWSW